MYRKGLLGHSKTLLTGLFIPFIWILNQVTTKRKLKPFFNQGTIGIGITLEAQHSNKKVLNANQLKMIVDELNISRLSIRINLNEAFSVNDHIDFIRHFKHYQLLIVILQDSTIIDNTSNYKALLSQIFEQLKDLDNIAFQIGNAVNRRKWGFCSEDDYFNFFQVAYQLRNQHYPTLKLIGGAVIDFEMPDYCRSLINWFNFKYDGFSSLLYVDRRGAPENQQLGMNLRHKIDFINSIITISNKFKHHKDKQLWITEVNWPLADTEPFAPAVGDVMVDEHQQANYLSRYFLLMLSTGKVKAGFWHQLIAPGYGLIDNRNNILRYRPSFDAFKTLCHWFNKAEILQFNSDNGFYTLLASLNDKGENQYVCAAWCNMKETTLTIAGTCTIVINQAGKELDLQGNAVTVNDSVMYFIGTTPTLFN